MNYFNDIINETIIQKKLIDVCLKKIDWSKRHIGFVEKYEPNNFLVMKELDQYGRVIGFREILFKNIKSIEYGGIYEKNLETIYFGNIWEKKKTYPRYIKDLRPDKGRLIKRLIDTQTVCTFFFKDNYVIGILQEVSKDQLLIKNISFFGVEDGISSFYIKSLTQIRYNGPLEIRVDFLRKYNIKQEQLAN